ncbi:ester cyclase [Arthrobacter sp. zg-Y40]|uniref:ester cyclase n=1 Tax=Arthrobacter sp. zg-Y40 TaxID=2886939 RepID=UPI001D13A874|nr:ester cyclase [Arthrobacter sp. zg-Y40]MCC3280512.1 ester cyclase [Arthrobacter sp. zg-Y40]
MSAFIDPNDTRYDDRSRALVRVGRDAIAQENPALLREYFSEDFTFHGPGAELDFAGLEANFARMRAAFSGFYCERYEIVSSGSLVGCRTEMGGTFDGPYEPTPFGTIHPLGGKFTLTLINMFRYDEDGKLAEEWAQHDNLEMMRQLGVELTAVDTHSV